MPDFRLRTDRPLGDETRALSPGEKSGPDAAIVVLGCRIDAQGKPYGASERRVAEAWRAFSKGLAPWIIVSGGKTWHGVSEADAFAARLVALGVPNERIVREKRSQRTRQNARYVARIIQERDLFPIFLVTCDWHLPRALWAFRHYGLHAVASPAVSPSAARALGRLGERVKGWLDWLAIRLERVPVFMMLALFMTLAACGREGKKELVSVAPGSRASAEPPPSAADSSQMRAILAAEQTRKTDAVPLDALNHRTPEVRETAARALARIADAKAVERLLPALSDELAVVVEFAAFGLGRARSGRDSELTRAIVLRAATLQIGEGPAPDTTRALMGLAAALGRLGTDEAERSLASWLEFPPPLSEAAALALGQLGAHRGRLEEATLVALLEAAAERETPVDAALHAFSRVTPPRGLPVERALELARRPKAGAGRDYRLRTLARLGSAEDLGKALAYPDLLENEAVVVARALAERGSTAQVILAEALVARVPEGAKELAALVDAPAANVLSALLEGLNGPSGAKDALTRLSRIPASKTDPPHLRRAARIRCAAARVLAEDDGTHPDLIGCDPDPEGRARKLALLGVLNRGSLRGPAGVRYRALAADADPRVRQAALRLIAAHRELEDPAALFADALAADAPGTRAVAAEVLAQYPDRANEARSKGSAPARRPDQRVIDGLTRALREPRPTDTVGVRTAVVDAAAALGLLGVLSDFEKDCVSHVLSFRLHAERALTQLGHSGRRCPPPEGASPLPNELGHLVTERTQLILETELGELTLELDPARAPVATTRIVDLVRAGFYDGTRVHRVVPGFVVQFGDPQGDGYGGAKGPALRSEPSPGIFDALSVGLAESGPDSGSSQLFVTLGRFPHLDGESTYLGRAGKGWERLIEGDRIVRVRIQK